MEFARVNPVLGDLARRRLYGESKAAAAMPPAPGADPAAAMGGGGAMPPGDPMAGGMAPAPGAAPAPAPPPADPGMMAQQMAMQGAAGMPPGGRPGGKKVEQQITDAKLYNLTFMVSKICEKLGIMLPPEMLVGAPPDPGVHSMAQQDLGASSAVPSLSGDPAAAAAGGDMGGAAPAPAPAPGGEAMPKMASWVDSLFLPDEGEPEPVKVAAHDLFSGAVPDPMASRQPTLAERVRANTARAGVLARLSCG